MRSLFTILGAGFFMLGSIFAQSPDRCSTMEAFEMRKSQDPGLEHRMEGLERRVQSIIENGDHRAGDVITIPIVFHIIHNGEPIGTGANISEEQVLSQLAVLNEDFRRLNADTINTPEDFLPVADDMNIEFCMAISDPLGNPTDGIDRYNSGSDSWGSIGAIDGTLKPATVWDSESFLNFWSVNFGGTGLLGYAQFPGDDPTTDGVVIGYQYVGRFPDNPFPGDFSGGRTATHEVGHWLNLRHIWGDGGCSVDDNVSDTPESDNSNYGCAETHVSCGTVDMVQNYMDYSDDACMNLFTRGQGDRMRASILGTRAGLITSYGCTVVETFTYSGNVIDAVTGLAVADAKVVLSGPTGEIETTTNAAGEFSISTFLEGTYTVFAGKWGYVTNEVTGVSVSDGAPPVTVEIDPGYYDDFMLDLEWQVSGSVATGDWQRATPITATFEGAISNPGVDVSGDLGTKAYVTGNGGGDAGANDVDDGTTTLTSPVFDLSDYSDPYISYYHWFYTGGGVAGSIPPNDVLSITLNNGLESAQLDLVDLTGSLSSWNFSNYRIWDYLEPTANMTLDVETADLLDGHIVEAGFDVFRVVDSFTVQSGIEDADLISTFGIYPNPAADMVNVTLNLNDPAEDLTIRIYNGLGQLVLEKPIKGDLRITEIIDISELAAGVYVLTAEDESVFGARRLVVP